MKLGKIMLMELRNSWRGYLIFTIVVVVILAGTVEIYPSVSKAWEYELEGSENIDIVTVMEGDLAVFKLTWVEHTSADNYTLLVDVGPHMIVPMDRIEGIEERAYIYTVPTENNTVPELYFSVLTSEDGERIFVGTESSVERVNPLEETLGLNYGDIRGFLSVIWGMWFVLLIGLYIAFLAVNSISRDFEEGRMDILLSQPISRRQYMLEKFSMVALFTFVLLGISGLVGVASVYSVGELETISAFNILSTTILSWPLFLVFITLAILLSVHLGNSRKALGMTFLFVLFQFGIHLVGDMAEALEYVKPYTVISYWNHESLLYGEGIAWANIGFLLAISIVFLILAVYLFERRDIPA